MGPVLFSFSPYFCLVLNNYRPGPAALWTIVSFTIKRTHFIKSRNVWNLLQLTRRSPSFKKELSRDFTLFLCFQVSLFFPSLPLSIWCVFMQFSCQGSTREREEEAGKRREGNREDCPWDHGADGKIEADWGADEESSRRSDNFLNTDVLYDFSLVSVSPWSSLVVVSVVSEAWPESQTRPSD